MLKRGNYSPSSYGSLAYNFQPSGNECPRLYGMLPQKKKKQISMPARNSSPALFVGLALCVIFLFTALMLRASLVLVSEETLLLESRISELREQQTDLKISHAEVFSLEETERYAVEVLGMKKPGMDQIRYLDFPIETELDQSEKENVDRDILTLLKEYFPG